MIAGSAAWLLRDPVLIRDKEIENFPTIYTYK